MSCQRDHGLAQRTCGRTHASGPISQRSSGPKDATQRVSRRVVSAVWACDHMVDPLPVGKPPRNRDP